jgi:hypothetical protein
MKDVSVSEKQFKAYQEVQASGETNMMDVRKVDQVSQRLTGVPLDRRTVQTIMRRYSALERLYS